MYVGWVMWGGEGCGAGVEGRGAGVGGSGSEHTPLHTMLSPGKN